MAETERTFAELQTLLADNTTQAISAQDLRDLMVTALGGYASIYVDGGAVAQSLTSTAAKLTAFTAAGPARGAAGSHANDDITINVDGLYRVSMSASLFASVATLVDLELFKGGVKESGFSARVSAPASSGVVVASFDGLVSLSNGDVLDVRGTVAPDADVTIRHAHFSVKRVG